MFTWFNIFFCLIFVNKQVVKIIRDIPTVKSCNQGKFAMWGIENYFSIMLVWQTKVFF